MTASAPGLVDRLFRHEAGRIVATLVRQVGPQRFDLAEEALQEAMTAALLAWPFGQVPDQPGAWLMRAARNHLIDQVRREARYRKLLPRLDADAAPSEEDSADAGPLHDDRLRLMFSCCHPTLAQEAQLALILKALCGFSLAEIAAAFFTSPAAVEKRVTRAKAYLRQSRSLFDLDSARQVRARLPSVQEAIYLLFSEGYHSVRAESPIRADLCHEAVRLAQLLDADPTTRSPTTHALLALLHLNLARLPGRIDDKGIFLMLADQDRGAWDPRHIALGFRHLAASAAGDRVTRLHLEAAIAAEHCRAESIEDTDWLTIVALYERLADMSPSTAIHVSRAIALGQAHGPRQGLAALAAIAADGAPSAYPSFDAARGEFRAALGETPQALQALALAHAAGRSPAERLAYERRASVLRKNNVELASSAGEVWAL